MPEEHDTETRDKKAWRRAVAASRALAKQHGLNSELADGVANASHQDAATQSMRRSEAIAALLEGLAGEAKGEAKAKSAAKSTTPSTARESE